MNDQFINIPQNRRDIYITKDSINLFQFSILNKSLALFLFIWYMQYWAWPVMDYYKIIFTRCISITWTSGVHWFLKLIKLLEIEGKSPSVWYSLNKLKSFKGNSQCEFVLYLIIALTATTIKSYIHPHPSVPSLILG